MKIKFSIGGIAVWLIGIWGGDIPAAPVPKEMPNLKCEMRWTGKFEYKLNDMLFTENVPDGAVVTITNLSDADIDIGAKTRFGPRVHLDLSAKDPTGAESKFDPQSVYSETEPQTHKAYLLKPGETVDFPVFLLTMVPEEKRVAGTYKVKAVYTIGCKDYESDEISVKWPFEKK